MKILNLRAKGWIGLKRGLGLDEIEIDFSKTSGLSAFEGANGSGKSTIIELLSPYNQLASRDGALYQHTFLRDSEKDLTFEYGGHIYRTLLKIDCKSQRSEGFIWKDGQPEVNGKISAYAKYIENLLGSPNLFFSSVFCAQNATKLSDMTTGQLKGLFAEFLRLDRFQGWENTAKQEGNILLGKDSQLEMQIMGLREAVQKATDMSAQVDGHRRDIAVLAEKREAMLAKLAEARKAAEALNQTIAANKANEQRRADLQQQINRLTQELAAAETEATAELDGLKTAWRKTKADLDACTAILADKEKIEAAAGELAGLETQAAEIQKEIDEKTAELPGHQQRVHDIETQITGLRQQLKDLDNDPEMVSLVKQFEEAEGMVRDRKNELTALDNDRDLFTIEAQISACADMAEPLNKRGATCPNPPPEDCGFIASAIGAIKRQPELEKRRDDINVVIAAKRSGLKTAIADIKFCAEKVIEEKEARRIVITDAKDSLDAQIKTLTHDLKNAQQMPLSIGEEIAKARKELATLRLKIAQQKVIAERLPDVRVAEARKDDLTAQLQENEKAGKAKREAWDGISIVRKASIKGLRGEYDKIVVDIEAEGKLEALNEHINVLDAVDLPALDNGIVAEREAIAGLEAQIGQMKAEQSALTAAETEKTRITQDISEWKYLQNACGKNGLQAMEIDGAAPLITGYANSLLSQAFGPLFTVKLLTQDEAGKECLDIMVITEDGEEVLLENLSGGQKVWNLMALRLAMTLLSKEKSGHTFLTAYADELDGALDPDNSVSFVNMYRAFMTAGGFQDFLFISHKPSCRAMADNVLHFEHGKQPYWG